MIHTKLIIPVAPFITPNPDMSTKRVNNLVNNAELINNRRKARVPDDGTFTQLMGTPSADNFKQRVDFPTPTQGDRNADDIHTLQRSKMTRAFTKYNDGLDYAFEEVDGVVAKRFKDKVEASQSNWDEEVAKGTLRFTGSRARGRQVASVMGYWLTGYLQTVNRLPEGSIVLVGGPYDISLPDLMATMRASVTQILTQTGVIISESGYDPTMLTRHNGRIKNLLEKLSDPLKAAAWVATRTIDKSYCVWFVEDGQLKLETQIYTA
ncbi:MAG: hypothetical protein HY762_01205 [Planctomycetes bacterium]|nr:hypothetical protein [Planctomycetota bacterium]